MHKVLAHLRKVKKDTDQEMREDKEYLKDVGTQCWGGQQATNRIRNNRVFLSQLVEAIEILNET